jgi:hypothetical protein
MGAFSKPTHSVRITSALIITLLATGVLLPLGHGLFDEAVPALKLAGLAACLAGTIMLCW